jgi:hypothetical protein
VVAKDSGPERSIAPSEVTITVSVVRRSGVRKRRERLAGIRVLARGGSALVLASLGLAASALLIAIELGNSRTGRHVGSPARSEERPAERAAIAAAFGVSYPLRCLRISISASDPDYARAAVDHGSGCGRYHGYLNASFHRVGGAWRLVSDEGQLFVPNSLLSACGAGHAGCAHPGGRASVRSRPGGS